MASRFEEVKVFVLFLTKAKHGQSSFEEFCNP
jgi:hypothetical protein